MSKEKLMWGEEKKEKKKEEEEVEGEDDEIDNEDVYEKNEKEISIFVLKYFEGESKGDVLKNHESTFSGLFGGLTTRFWKSSTNKSLKFYRKGPKLWKRQDIEDWMGRIFFEPRHSQPMKLTEYLKGLEIQRSSKTRTMTHLEVLLECSLGKTTTSPILEFFHFLEDFQRRKNFDDRDYIYTVLQQGVLNCLINELRYFVKEENGNEEECEEEEEEKEQQQQQQPSGENEEEHEGGGGGEEQPSGESEEKEASNLDIFELEDTELDRSINREITKLYSKEKITSPTYIRKKVFDFGRLNMIRSLVIEKLIMKQKEGKPIFRERVYTLDQIKQEVDSKRFQELIRTLNVEVEKIKSPLQKTLNGEVDFLVTAHTYRFENMVGEKISSSSVILGGSLLVSCSKHSIIVHDIYKGKKYSQPLENGRIVYESESLVFTNMSSSHDGKRCCVGTHEGKILLFTEESIRENQKIEPISVVRDNQRKCVIWKVIFVSNTELVAIVNDTQGVEKSGIVMKIVLDKACLDGVRVHDFVVVLDGDVGLQSIHTEFVPEGIKKDYHNILFVDFCRYQDSRDPFEDSRPFERRQRKFFSKKWIECVTKYDEENIIIGCFSKTGEDGIYVLNYKKGCLVKTFSVKKPERFNLNDIYYQHIFLNEGYDGKTYFVACTSNGHLLIQRVKKIRVLFDGKEKNPRESRLFIGEYEHDDNFEIRKYDFSVCSSSLLSKNYHLLCCEKRGMYIFSVGFVVFQIIPTRDRFEFESYYNQSETPAKTVLTERACQVQLGAKNNIEITDGRLCKYIRRK